VREERDRERAGEVRHGVCLLLQYLLQAVRGHGVCLLLQYRTYYKAVRRVCVLMQYLLQKLFGGIHVPRTI